MEIAQLIISSLCLVGICVDIFMAVRATRPMRRQNFKRDLTRIAVSSAEQKFRGQKGKGKDKARYARQYLIDSGLGPAEADVLVERAVTELFSKEELKPVAPLSLPTTKGTP